MLLFYNKLLGFPLSILGVTTMTPCYRLHFKNGMYYGYRIVLYCTVHYICKFITIFKISYEVITIIYLFIYPANDSRQGPSDMTDDTGKESVTWQLQWYFSHANYNLNLDFVLYLSKIWNFLFEKKKSVMFLKK